MKRIFYILHLFFLILGLFWGAERAVATQETKNSSEDISVVATEKSKDFLSDFYTSLRQRMERAEKLEPADISLTEKPENFDFFTFLVLMDKDAGLLTGHKGLGKEQSFEFGRTRLASCMGNVNNQPVLLTALTVVLNEGWILKKPVIPASSSDLWQAEEIYYPLRLKNDVPYGKTYEEMVAFPIVYHLTDENKPFQVDKEISLTACRGEACVTETQTYALFVDKGKGYQTDVCPFILSELSRSPQKLPETIKASVYQNEEGFVQINLSFPEAVSEADIYDESGRFVIYKKFVQGKEAHLILKPDQSLSTGEKLKLTLITSLGSFELEAVPENHPFIFDTPVFEGKRTLWYGFYFFFFSPLYLLFWSLRPKDNLELKRIFYFVTFNIIVFMLILGGLLYWNVPFESFFQTPAVLLLQTGLVFYLLCRPFIRRVGHISVLLFLMPYPFLYQLGYIFSTKSFFYTTALVAWWGFCAWLPYFFTFRHAILFQSFKNAERPIRQIIRLPLFIMFCWMSFAFVLSVFQSDHHFSEKELIKMVRNNQSVLVFVYRPPCISCTLNQVALQYLEPTSSLLQTGKLSFMTLNQQTPAGEEFLNKYRIQKGESFYLLFTPKQKYGERLQNHYIQPEEWTSYLSEAGIIETEKTLTFSYDTFVEEETPPSEAEIKEALEALYREMQAQEKSDTEK